MDTLQCAIVLAKLDTFDQEIVQRQAVVGAVARRYHELLTNQEEPRAKTPSRQETPNLPIPPGVRIEVAFPRAPPRHPIASSRGLIYTKMTGQGGSVPRPRRPNPQSG